MGNSRNKKIMKVMSVGALSTSILATCFIPGQTSFAVTDSSTTIKDIDSYIKNISNADRERIHSMQETDYTGLMISPDVNLNEDTPLNVIVQFKQAPSEIDYKEKQSNGITATLDDSLKLVDESHKKFKDQLNGNSKLNNSADIKREYKYVFNGVSMTLPANQVKELLNLDSVKAVYEDKEVSVEPLVEQNGEPANNSSINLNNMEQIGAKKLHNEGITGKGVKVGVIDTGIDYTHPDLKDVYKGGYDFVNNDSDPMETSYDDWKKSGQPEFNQLSGEPYYTAHGTHVSGIIAGTGKNHSNFAVTGVAPQVELYGYKVLGPYGSGGDSNIIAGIDKAVEDKMDVINLSLGAGITNPLDPMSVAINNATLAGTVCVIAAGNGGTGGKYTIGSPASSALGITVGANSSPITIQTNNAVANSVNETFKLDNMRMMATDYSDINTLKGSTLPIVFVGKGNTYDFTGKNVKDKIVLMERGDLTLNVKIKNAKANGAKAVIMFNNIPGETYIPYYFGNNFDFIPTFSIPNDQGIKLINMLNKGAVNLTMNDFGTFESEGDKLADFSSRGPARRYYDIKPEITAPGVAVFSSIPAYYNGAAHKDDYEHAYARFDGTSMAAPHVAGSAALILQAHPDYTPQQVKLALMNTADELNGSYSVFEKGSGRIDTDEAVHTSIQIGVKDEVATMEDGQKVMISETSGDLSYGAIVTTDKDYKDKKSIEITNNSNKNKVFDVKVKFNKIPGYDQDAEKNGISLDMPSEVTAKVNGTSKIMPKLHVPATAELGLYEGTIYFTNKDDSNEVYQIPFGLNKMEQGIQDVFLTTKAFNTRRDLPFAINGGTGIAFSLKSRMETVDIVLKNADTGQELGIIDSFDDGFNEGKTFGLDAGFNGLYFPFTGNPDQPVHITKSLASPGRYEIEIIGTNEDGKVFKKSKQIIIDNTLPTLKTNVPGGVYEVDDTGLKISGNITDSSIDLWNKNGENIDQSNNKVNVTSATNPSGNVPLVVDSKGNFEYTRMIQAGRDFSTMTLQSQDIATNGVQNHPDFTYTLIRKGLPYMKLTADKSNAKYGETVKVTLNEQNIKNFMGGEFTIAYPYQLFDFQSAELNNEYVNAAKSMGLTAKLTAQDLKTDTSNNWVKLVTNLDGTTPSSGINANMPIATLTFKVKDAPSVYTKWVQQFGFQTAKANILGQPQTTITNKFGRGLNIIPTYSILEGGFLPDGFIPSNQIWLDPKKDYSKVGAEVYVIGGTDGKRYDATINSAARFSVKNLPLLDQSYEIVIKIPGHFERHVKVDEMVDTYDGMAAGKLKYFYYATMRAGDVNHDNVIDILDAVYITNKLNTNDREADINFDGVVNAKDLDYVKKNYLMQNPDAPSGHIQPVTKYKGKTLEDFTAPLG
ncbi:S8 family serine peptidase [Gottfriedia acidiceleris]|uniref:S8 family serine peptidase n=1 Tax=Gottfriedia acidiceleris TaxID=371036 RepID=A0ABY4JID0_9BACI|nr:S8 family serine peptidase [Gottfriedia acidiceleris]UPM52795.1 S8 family serine peptidase [Gottfriedia acidiceleris]